MLKMWLHNALLHQWPGIVPGGRPGVVVGVVCPAILALHRLPAAREATVVRGFCRAPGRNARIQPCSRPRGVIGPIASAIRSMLFFPALWQGLGQCRR